MLPRYIAIEGPDQAGKTTLINNILDPMYKNKGYNTLIVKEPYFLGDQIKPLLNYLLSEFLTNKLESSLLQHFIYLVSSIFDLFMADRYKLLETLIKPTLNENSKTIILSDRCFISSWIYQYKLIIYILNEIHKIPIYSNANVKYTTDQIYNSLLNFTAIHSNLPDIILLLSGNDKKRENNEEFMDTNLQLNQILIQLYQDITDRQPHLSFLKQIQFMRIDLKSKYYMMDIENLLLK